MRPHITPIVIGTAMTSPVLARCGRMLLGLRRNDPGFILHAVDVDSGEPRWSVALSSFPTLCVHEAAGCIATSEAERLSFWDLDTGAPWAKSIDGFHAKAPMPDARLLTLEDVPGVSPDGRHVDEGTRACVVDIVTGVVVKNFGLAGRVDHVVTNDAGTRLLAHTPFVAVAKSNASAGHRSVLWDVAARAPLLALDAQLSSRTLLFRPGCSDTLVSPYHCELGGPLVITVDPAGAVPGIDVAVIADDDSERAPLESVALSPDGRFLATAHADQRDNHWIVGCAICVWDLKTRTRVHDLALESSTWPKLLTFDDGGRVVGVYETWDRREHFIVPKTW